MYIKLNAELEKMRKKNSDINEKNGGLQSEIEELKSKNSNKDFKIIKLSQDIKDLKKSLDIIIFIDLSKTILDNMISYVEKSDKKVMKGLFERKEKLNMIKQEYEYNWIYYMKNPIEEIIQKYYSSISKSHVIIIVQIITGKPFWLVLEPEKEIDKRFLSVLLDYKGEDAFRFIKLIFV